MEVLQLKLIIPIIILSLSFSNNQSKEEFERLKIWEDIRIAAKEKRIDFLLEISNDTIQCVECNEGEDWRSKEEFFSNHLEQIEISDTKEYSVYSESYYKEKGYTKRYRINYAYEGGEGKGYNLYNLGRRK